MSGTDAKGAQVPRILIVDDIEENLKVLTDTLVREGYRPLQAKSGERAIEIARAGAPDLILLDIRMPGMDGFETIAGLKADPSTADIPVIFISALNQIEDKVNGFKAGAVDYVSKPFQKEEVLARVGTHLRLRRALRAEAAEREKSDSLLRCILPEAVARELKETGTSEPRSYDDVTVLFSDFVDFTTISSRLAPKALISELDSIFSEFDAIMAANGCERIKTIGDAYFAVAGMPEPLPGHAAAMAEAALAMVAALEARRGKGAADWRVRVGIHTGPVVAGIVGTTRYIYDVFGDTVNIASRMEAAGESGRINVSAATRAALGNSYAFESRGAVEVKGKGAMEMYFLDRRA